MKQSKYTVGAMLVLVLLSACCAVSSQSNEHTSMNNKPKHHTDTGFQNDPFVETAAAKGPLFYMRRAQDSLVVPDVPEGHILSEADSIELLSSLKVIALLGWDTPVF